METDIPELLRTTAKHMGLLLEMLANKLEELEKENAELIAKLDAKGLQ